MTDVRLTATNPVDSSVVPVACNEKGELKLEEPLINSDEFVAKTGDTMTGNLHLGDGITLNPDGSAQFAGGNLDVYDTGKVIYGADKITLDGTDGSATFAGDVQAGNDPQQGRYSGVKLRELGVVQAARPEKEGIWSGFQTRDDGSTSSATSLINADGSAEFAGTIIHNNWNNNATGGLRITSGSSGGAIEIKGNGSDFGAISIRANGNDSTNELVKIKGDGSAEFSGPISSTVLDGYCFEVTNGSMNMGGFFRNSSGNNLLVKNVNGQTNAHIFSGGNAMFAGDVIVGSRGKQWMIVESNGLAHLVEQTRSNEISTADLVNPDSNEISTADLVDPPPSIEYPPLRDIPGELTMVEEQLQKVLEKLRMVPDAGWEVWDGSD